MAWILRTLWSGLLSGLKLGIQPGAGTGPQSTPMPQPVDGVVALPAAKRFYSLIIEVRPAEADAETLQLFSDEVGTSLAAILKLPAGCQLRRCTSVSPDFAQILINM